MYAPIARDIIIINNNDDVSIQQVADITTPTAAALTAAALTAANVSNYPYIRIVRNSLANPTPGPATQDRDTFAHIEGNNIRHICKRGCSTQIYHRLRVTAANYPASFVATGIPGGTELTWNLQFNKDTFMSYTPLQDYVSYFFFQVPKTVPSMTLLDVHTAMAAQINANPKVNDLVVATVVGNDLVLTAKGPVYRFDFFPTYASGYPASFFEFNYPGNVGTNWYGIGDPGTGTWQSVLQMEKMYHAYSYEYMKNYYDNPAGSNPNNLIASGNSITYRTIPGACYDMFFIEHDRAIIEDKGPYRQDVVNQTVVAIQASTVDVESAFNAQFEQVLNAYASFYGFGINTLGYPSTPGAPVPTTYPTNAQIAAQWAANGQTAYTYPATTNNI